MNNFIYHKPIYRTVDNINGHKILSEVGDTAFMCPECFHIIETNISITKTINNANKICDFVTNNEYYGDCPNCKSHVRLEEIDANMAQIINILNTKGYFTAFCCEGHIEQNIYDGKEEFQTPYIYFYLWQDAEILDSYPLPKDWYIDNPECEVFCIRGSKMPNCFEDEDEYNEYLDYIKNNWNHEEIIKEIYDWAVSLPTKDENIKYVDHDYIRLFGQSIINKNAEKIINAYNENIECHRE